MKPIKYFITCLVMLCCLCGSELKLSAQTNAKHLKISGVYPHLTVFNEGGGIPCGGNGNEGGIGAVVPWAGKLWMVTYSPHCPGGSSDKLYSIDNNLELTIHPESVGGTPANRMIHKESNQLIIGPYFINQEGKIRVIPPSVMPGRLTATTRHLTEPEHKVYFFDMEGMIYEADVHTLAVKKLFHKPVPGWHGKGAYTGQNRFIIANNGEHKVFDIKEEDLRAGGAPRNKDEMGVLASWDGNTWTIIERKQFTDVTGPGGIYGNEKSTDPVWSIGWDKRSVILKLLDNGQWFNYRLPKSTHTYDHWGGWYTEWPRIREVGNNKMLMDMHGMFYDFPKTFSKKNSSGLKPVSRHLRYIPDFCNWNGQLVLATDETSIMQNPFAGRSQSNLWFGSWNDLKEWGTPYGWGGPWMDDTIEANTPSDPFLMSGFEKKVLHLSHQSQKPVTFTIESDAKGINDWKTYKTVTVAANGYGYLIFPPAFSPDWIRIRSNSDCIASAFFHLGNNAGASDAKLFNALAGINEAGSRAALIRPGHNKNLQVLTVTGGKNIYEEVDEKLAFFTPDRDSSDKMVRILKLQKDFETDDASVIIKDTTGTFRLPKTAAAYDKPFAEGWPRGKREIESERYMLNAHGTFYEVGRESGFAAIRPVTTHKKRITDFCTWRGLLVISGTKNNAAADGHYFSNDTKSSGLWFGAVDDLWKLGKPVGEGGVWKNSQVKANEPSLPYLMTGYDKKKISLSSDKDIIVTLEVDVDHNGWHEYKKIRVPAGKVITHVFPDGYNAHWIRATADKDCKATAWLVYE